MAREALWAAVEETSDAMAKAVDAWLPEKAPSTHAAVTAAVHAFAGCLDAVIGDEAAFRFEASWQAVVDATERVESLTSTLATSAATLHAGDASMMLHLRDQQEEAVREFLRVENATQGALDEARTRDDEERVRDGR